METLIIIVLALLVVFLVLCVLTLAMKEKGQSTFNTYYGGSETTEDPDVQMRFEFPEQLVADAELIFDEVPVFIQTPYMSQAVGQAVFFRDENRINALIEIPEENEMFFKHMTDHGLNGISIAPVRAETEQQGEENNNG